MGEKRVAHRKKNAKPFKPVNMGAWMPALVIVGFIIGFAICYLTFSYLGGN
jgi:hypothetical protein